MGSASCLLLLCLLAVSTIVALHHDQDFRVAHQETASDLHESNGQRLGHRTKRSKPNEVRVHLSSMFLCSLDFFLNLLITVSLINDLKRTNKLARLRCHMIRPSPTTIPAVFRVIAKPGK